MDALLKEHPDRILYKRSSYKPHFGTKESACKFSAFVDESAFIKPDESKTDASFYRPTSELVREFVASGKNVLAAQSGQYDFKTDGKENGKDDGREISIFDSPYEPDSADVSSELQHKAKNTEKELLNIKKSKLSKEEKEADRKALADAIKGSSAPSDNSADSSDAASSS